MLRLIGKPVFGIAKQTIHTKRTAAEAAVLK